MGDDVDLWMRVKLAEYGWSTTVMLKSEVASEEGWSAGEEGWSSGEGWLTKQRSGDRQRLVFEVQRGGGRQRQRALTLEVELSLDDHGTCTAVVYAEYWVRPNPLQGSAR